METGIVVVIVIVLAVFVLRRFDNISGRGPKQVSQGINDSSLADKQARVACPRCAELILPAAKKCPFCQSELGKGNVA